MRSTPIRLQHDDALIIVDVQNDFLPGAALAVPGGNAVIAPLNAWIRRFDGARLPIFASRDWHPPDHCSFAAHGGRWPPHCIAGSNGAALADALALPATTIVIDKALQPDQEAYSAFSGTQLDGWLHRLRVRRLFIGGLATDYCVRETVIDALRSGYRVVLLRDAIRAVEAHPGDGEQAIAAMLRAGATIVDNGGNPS